MNTQTSILTSLTMIALCACSLAPTYQQPNIDSKDLWIDAALANRETHANNIAEINWQEYFTHPQLRYLIHDALNHNHDLRKATLNVEITQAQYGITRANNIPSLGGHAEYRKSRTPQDLSLTGQSITSDRYQVGLGLSNFELDLFGRVRSMNTAALNRYLATREARDAAKISLISGVAQSWYQTRILYATAQLALQIAHTREATLKIARVQHDVGVISTAVYNGIVAETETAKSDYAQLQNNYQQALAALNLLVGRPVAESELALSDNLTAQLEHELVDFQLPENLPSSILMNRPDIRQAEYQLKAANADIGAARAAFFPSISLTGNAGFASNDIHHLFNGTNLLWSFTPQVDLPIFTAGKRLANLKISHLQQKSMVEHYQQTVKQAFTEIAKELYAHQSLSKQSEATHQTQESTQQRLQAERIRYQTGLGSYRELLDAERDYYRSTQAVLQTDLQRLINHIQLYASLGGGRK